MPLNSVRRALSLRHSLAAMSPRKIELLLLTGVVLLLWIGTYRVVQHRLDRCLTGSDSYALRPAKLPPLNLQSADKPEIVARLSEELSAQDANVLAGHIIQWRASANFLQEKVSASPELKTISHLWILSGPDRYLSRFWSWWLLMILGFGISHLVLRRKKSEVSGALLPVVVLLCGLGVLIQMNFSDPLRGRDLAIPFLQGTVLGITALIATFGIGISRLEGYRYLPALGALMLGTLLVCLGKGPAGTSTKIVLWGFQPVEPIKLLFLLFLASYFAAKQEELRRIDSLTIGRVSLPRVRDVVPLLAVTMAIIALFYFQRDLGPSLVFYLVFLGLFLLVTHRYVLAATGLLSLVAAFVTGYHMEWSQTVVTRVEMWLKPFENSRNGGSQLAESFWALASGNFNGAGTRHAIVSAVPAGHTDLVLSAAGELWGFPGLTIIVAALLAVCLLILETGRRAGSVYGSFLCYGAALLSGLQAAVILAGSIGLLPLTGVAVPFLSYGKSGMVVNLATIGLVLNAGARTVSSEERISSNVPERLRVIHVALLVLVFGLVLAKAFQVMVMDADEILVKPAFVLQADGAKRYQYNRRLLAFARMIERGQIVDCKGEVLATSSREAAVAAGMKDPDPRKRRFYPLGPALAQVLGHFSGIWTPAESVEKKMDASLRGYSLEETAQDETNRKLVAWDFSHMLPLFRDWASGSGEKFNSVSNSTRDVSLSIDARVQRALYKVLSRNVAALNVVDTGSAAAVVLDAQTGEIRASVSLPSYDPNQLSEKDAQLLFGPKKAALDRTREFYPPGSGWKLVVSITALEAGWWDLSASDRRFCCFHSNEIEWNDRFGLRHLRHVKDDEMESPHGWIDMDRAFSESCNGYFALVGVRMGAGRLWSTAKGRLHLSLPGVRSSNDLEAHLADNSYGQADISVSPLEMATVAACVANGGWYRTPRVFNELPGSFERACSPESARLVFEWMQEVVTHGTGKRAQVPGLLVGGKTGTAQNQRGKASHSWFVGYGAYPGAEKPISFAFFIEHGGYGGQAAAQAAHDFLVEYVTTDDQ
jgi:cell division protein FtsW (lipid II flippase)/cell division protein FtsI/penicillin-binding protein 2